MAKPTQKLDESAAVFTTGQVAQVMGVSPSTVNALFDGGKIKGFRIPPGGHRRVPRAMLLRFLREGWMPVPAWLEGG